MASASDDFERASLGANWTTVTSAGAMAIVSSTAARCNVDSTRSGAYYNATSFSTDHYSEIIRGSGSSGLQGAGPCARVSTGAQTLYYVYTYLTSGADDIRLYDCVAATYGIIGTYNSGTVNSGDVIRLTCNGTAISVSQNGTSRISVTSSTVTSGVNAGIWSYFQSEQINSWAASDLTVAASAVHLQASPSMRVLLTR